MYIICNSNNVNCFLYKSPTVAAPYPMTSLWASVKFSCLLMSNLNAFVPFFAGLHSLCLQYNAEYKCQEQIIFLSEKSVYLSSLCVILVVGFSQIFIIWGSSLLFLVFSFLIQKWMLDFVKCFVCLLIKSCLSFFHINSVVHDIFSFLYTAECDFPKL